MVYIYTYENRRFRLVDTIDLKEAAEPYDNFIKRVTLKSVTKKKEALQARSLHENKIRL